MKDKTVLVVAHRLSTVENATKIVVIDKGIVVEQGERGKGRCGVNVVEYWKEVR